MKQSIGFIGGGRVTRILLQAFKNKGFIRIANMAGGIVDWERDGLPLKTNIEERLSGSCMSVKAEGRQETI